jgi:WhiB family redox-sensing transcriptional regulator
MTGSPNQDPHAARATPPVAALPDRACAGEDPEIFFPQHAADVAEAKAICDLCPHVQPCLEWALDTRQMHGIWAGTTGDERRELLRPELPRRAT